MHNPQQDEDHQAMLPTQETYDQLQTAYDYFNRTLFDAALPPCLITLQREKRTHGYFCHQRFVNDDGQRTDEIAMNPAYFAGVPLPEILQTLAHEMVHLKQAHFGTPGRRGYHNREWADWMQAIGLMPSSTGAPGGRQVGDRMSDYIIPGGPFDRACNELLATGFSVTWKDRLVARDHLQQLLQDGEADLSAYVVEADAPKESRSNRRKYSCPACGVNAWGRPGLHLICGDDEVALKDVGT